MSGVKPRGYQLNILDIANEISANTAAIEQIASSIVSDSAAKEYFNQEYLRQDGTKSLTGNLNFNGNDIVNVGTVDGRDLSVDGNLLDLHLNDVGKHRVINDGGVSSTELWSSQKIDSTFSALDLNSLSDVNVSGPILGEMLYFNGSVWTQMPNCRTYYGTIQTTDEQVAVVLSIPIPENMAGTYQIMVQGFELATGNMRSEIIHGAVKHYSNTVIVVDSNVIDLFKDVGTDGWSLTAIHNNANKTLEVKVIGEAGKTIQWRTKVELLIG